MCDAFAPPPRGRIVASTTAAPPMASAVAEVNEVAQLRRTTATTPNEAFVATSNDDDNDKAGLQKQQMLSFVQREVVPKTMGQAATTFFLGDYNGPRAVVVALVGLSVWRIQLLLQYSTYTATIGTTVAVGLANDVLAVSAAVVFWWLQEHWMHKYLLHSHQDWHGKHIHEDHHLKPYHHLSIDPAPLMLSWLTAVHLILRMTLPLPLAVTATIGYAAAGLFYEWSHFIVHTKVRFPRGSYWQRMKDHHIRHHLVDSDFWLAFSVTHVDDLFGTNPDVEDVKRRQKLSGTNDLS